MGSGAAEGGAVAAIVTAVSEWRAERSGAVVVAIDGHGASGKTTLAELVAAPLGAVVIHTDDYFRDLGAGARPALMGAMAAMGAMAPMARYYDWERIRVEASAPGPGPTIPILIEGVSSASPALADLVTHAILVVAPEEVRLQRLRARIRPEEWDEAWLEEERVYFASLPAGRFQLVVAGG